MVSVCSVRTRPSRWGEAWWWWCWRWCCCWRTEEGEVPPAERGEELPDRGEEFSASLLLPPPFVLRASQGIGVRSAPPRASSDPTVMPVVVGWVVLSAEGPPPPTPLARRDMADMSGIAGGKG